MFYFFKQREKKQLEESLAEIKEQEEEMSRANRALTLRLEDVQVNLHSVSVAKTFNIMGCVKLNINSF